MADDRNAEPLADPANASSPRGRTGGVGQHLTEMRMVGGLQLVLDDQHGVVCDVSADKIKGVAADRMLRRLELGVDSQRLRQAIGVL